jgi:PPK2 family polyphosphate:nucleotide phosphotransferase
MPKRDQRFDVDAFRVRPDQPVDLADLPTKVADVYEDKAEYEELLEARTKRLRHLQNLLYADDRHALLVIFQAMDAAGKDGAIKHVMSGVNPQGCQVFSFKAPSVEELDHDFLWRAVRCLPERGRLGLFNRSYYEETLVVRVHRDILDRQPLPEKIGESADIWAERYRSIRHFEQHLVRNGTRIVKFFLHLSKEEQRTRFLERIDDPEKQWKFSAGDVRERGHWDAYQQAYGETIAATSTDDAPWYAIPADGKKNARLFISEVLIRTLEALPLAFPAATETPEALAALRAQLVAEG